MSQGEAYLVGLLHELGSLPVILEWAPKLAISSDSTIVGSKLAEGWRLPSCVAEYFDELRYPKTFCPRTEFVQRAHEMPILLPVEYLSDHAIGLQIAAFDRP